MRFVLFTRLDRYDDSIWSRFSAFLYSYPYLYLYFWINGADLLWTLLVLDFYFRISIKLLTAIITNELQTGRLSLKACIFNNFCYSRVNWMYADLWDFFLYVKMKSENTAKLKAWMFVIRITCLNAITQNFVLQNKIR